MNLTFGTPVSASSQPNVKFGNSTRSLNYLEQILFKPAHSTLTSFPACAGMGDSFGDATRNETALVVVRFQHLHPTRVNVRSKCWNLKTTRKFNDLVELSNLTFGYGLAAAWVPNVKFIPIAAKVRRKKEQAIAVSVRFAIAPMAIVRRRRPLGSDGEL